MGDETSAGSILRHLDDLRVALDVAGFVTKIEETGQSPRGCPFLRVTNPKLAQLSEAIRCDHHAPDGGALWFYWSWGEPMCPAHDVHRAAKELGHVVGDGK
ncbi:MAG TPA: hypothetical protein VE465_01485 [Streptosporangiaceae bacterium]|jgi:hypothetical protein|nr:hypothetical protein [Streptosporangiaceae bacterium]